MIELAIILRTSFMFKQNAHQMVARVVSIQDHEFFGSAYEKALSHYDNIIERIIGLDMNPDLINVQVQSVQMLQQHPCSYKENKECFTIALSLNKKTLDIIEAYIKSGKYSQGTQNLLAGIADEIEKELYFIKQRIK